MAPRAQAAGNPSLRNRNRVTNKTRLKVIKGNIDADPIVLDEDEERARVVSTAGVDAEDANEHHLQAVLSAASHRQSIVAQRAIQAANGELKKKSNENASKPSTAYIPTPDAAGVVDNWEELYPASRWVDPSSYVKFSYTVEETLPRPLNDGFTYVMDERDLAWLEKNNAEARGEGTSSQAAPAAAGTTTRSGGSRTSKGKGKEADAPLPVHISEDDFELVMGLFEKLTHDKTPFLHVSFQQHQANSIPPFSDYSDDFFNELPSEHFVGYLRPSNLPTPSILSRMAKAIYPHWRDRKVDRDGHRIIPVLNFDESDIRNESYICFRRRDTKAIRKTRAQQISSAEKLSRLRAEIGQALEMARNIMSREVHKKETHLESRIVWEKRHAFVDLKRKYPQLGGREEEDLLFDKERIPKKPKPATENPPLGPLRLPKRPLDPSASPAPVEPQMRPKERFNILSQNLETALKKMKDQDHGWEDQVESAFQQPPLALGDRFFKPVNTDPSSRQRQSQFLRLRVGRGGRMHIDRRSLPCGRPQVLSEDSSSSQSIQKSSASQSASQHLPSGGLTIDDLETDVVRNKHLLVDRLERLSERWRFDCTGESVGADEEDRVLFDDFNPKHMRFQTQFSLDAEPLVTDSRLYLFDQQAGMHNYVEPIKKLSVQHVPVMRRDVQQQRVPPVATQTPPNPSNSAASTMASPINSNPHSPVKPPPSVAVQHNRAPSSGPQRPSSSASANGISAGPAPSSSPVSHGTSMQANGFAAQSNPSVPPSMPLANANSNMPSGMVNGNGNGVAGTLGANANGLGLQFNLSNLTATQQQQLQLFAQKQTMQKHHANMQRNGQTAFVQHAVNGVGSNENALNGTNLMTPVNMNLKLPPSRQMQQMQWTAGQRAQAAQMSNGDLAAALQGISNMPNLQQLAAMGVLSANNVNGVNGHLSPGRNAHSPPNAHGHISPHMGNSPHAQAQTQTHVSPNRNMQTPVPPSPSPLLQQLPPNLVGNIASQNQGF